MRQAAITHQDSKLQFMSVEHKETVIANYAANANQEHRFT